MKLISPLNYAGNKVKLLGQILSLFQKDIDIFVDAFAGSGVVSLNSNAKKIICNDINEHSIELVKYLYESDSTSIIKSMEAIIEKYGFTDSTNPKNHYIEYKHEGLSHYNKEPFAKLREDYNTSKSVDLLFALIIYGFNHYLRFNKKKIFNVPVGKVDFSASLRKKTIEFSDGIKKHDVVFIVGSYLDLDLYKNCTSKSLVYFDPPYSITTAPYNSEWSKEDDQRLFDLFDYLTSKGIKVAMSNVFLSNGKENKELIEWSKKYKVNYMKRQYRNANYQKVNVTDTIEVLITNYELEG